MVASVLATALVVLRWLWRDGGRLDLDGARGLAAIGLGPRWTVAAASSRDRYGRRVGMPRPDVTPR